jgi:methylmalonyl-CoA mutase N-terminal domain/subunit
MTKLKSPSSNGAPDTELIATIEEQSAELRLLRKEVAEWRKKYEKGELRDIGFTNSEKEVQPIYSPLDAAETSAEALGMPGFYPYTRGVHPTGYRGRLWTMRQFAGFGSERDTNERYKFLLAQGQTGLSVAFDFPTLMGYDSDHPASEGEVGKCGVAIDSLEDMEILFDGIDLEKTTVSMTINSPASVLWAMYLVVAEKQGADWKKISGTIQNDILKEYIAQKEYIYPPAPSMRLVVDTFEFGSRFTPRFNTISISGYHIREAGSTALQELAFTIYDGVEYVEWARRRGLDFDEFGPRLSFFFNAHNDFFEEIAKYRAARKIWYRLAKDRFGAKNARTWLMRFHTQTAGVSLPAQQPMNNIARVALQALAAVLGGTQSLHTDSYDEALALPTEQAARIALRTQQIIAYESGVAQTVDPLGGAYFVENQTLQMEKGAFEYFAKLDQMGGMVKAIELFLKDDHEALVRNAIGHRWAVAVMGRDLGKTIQRCPRQTRECSAITDSKKMWAGLLREARQTAL